jgi:hypothetical protein
MSSGSVASMMSTVGRGGLVCPPLSVIVAMLLGTGVGSFVGRGACIIVAIAVVVVVNCRETVVVVNIEDIIVVLGVIVEIVLVPILVAERDEGHG